jgi:hypothetical protein
VSTSRSRVAGPSVATIFVLRMARDCTPEQAEGPASLETEPWTPGFCA